MRFIFFFILFCAVLVVVAVFTPVLSWVGSFLVVEDKPARAAAIVVLGGDSPFRELGAAALYKDGYAPKVVVVPGPQDRWNAYRRIGVEVVREVDLRREVLIRLGVPEADVTVLRGEAPGTLEELEIVYKELGKPSEPVILVTSNYHARRTRLTWEYVTDGKSRGIVRVSPHGGIDPSRWWQKRKWVRWVVREYMGFVNLYLGFPVAAE